MKRSSMPTTRRTPDQAAAYRANWFGRYRHTEGRCEVRLQTCTGKATEPHHVWPQREARRLGVAVDDSFENLRSSCTNCNAQVEQLGVQTAQTLGLYSPHPLDPQRRET